MVTIPPILKTIGNSAKGTFVVTEWDYRTFSGGWPKIGQLVQNLIFNPKPTKRCFHSSHTLNTELYTLEVLLKLRTERMSPPLSQAVLQNPEKGNTNQVLLLKWGPQQRSGHYDGSEILGGQLVLSKEVLGSVRMSDFSHFRTATYNPWNLPGKLGEPPDQECWWEWEVILWFMEKWSQMISSVVWLQPLESLEMNNKYLSNYYNFIQLTVPFLAILMCYKYSDLWWAWSTFWLLPDGFSSGFIITKKFDLPLANPGEAKRFLSTWWFRDDEESRWKYYQTSPKNHQRQDFQ